MVPDSWEAFKALIRSTGAKAKPSTPSKFVRKMEEIPILELSPQDPCDLALELSEKALIGKFTGLWPSPKAVTIWMNECWKHLVKGKVDLCAAGRGFFAFTFSRKEDRDLVFRSGPYFMGSRGLFLAPWTLDFNPEAEITAAPVWVRLPHLPLHLWGKNSLKDIGNKLGRFLESTEPKGNIFHCARICVEVNLEKGLPEAIKLTLGDWYHIQELDYEQIPFKCLHCHVYGHFAKSCPKASEVAGPDKAEEFQTVTNRRRPTRRKEPFAQASKGTPKEGAPLENHNSFEALQEDEIQVPEAKAPEEEPPRSGELPGQPELVVAAAPAASEEVGLVEPGIPPSKQVAHETSPPVESPASRKDGFSSKSAGDSGSGSCPVPSPPLTRGRKTNKERREAEASANIFSGSQKTLAPFLKGKNPG